MADIVEIRRIATHPAVWPGFGGKADPQTWVPPVRDGVEWWAQGGVVICWHRLRPETWEVHIGALPEARGTVKARALEALEWFRSKHGKGMLLGFIPRGNVAAIANARAVGMKVLIRSADRSMVGMEF